MIHFPRQTMQVLTGDSRAKEIVAKLEKLRWGRMWIDRKPEPYDGEPWGFDNGAYRAWTSKQKWDAGEFKARLDRAHAVGTPMLAAVPDIVAGGLWSLEFSMEWREQLPDDWPWYLVVQDGMKTDDVRSCVDRFAGIFLGGTTRFKSTAGTWRVFAARHGVKFHYGRAGTAARVEHAVACGVDSLDSALPLWTRERFAEFAGYFRKVGPPQAMLPTLAESIAKGMGA